MVDKDFCMSSFLAFRYIIDDDKDFFESQRHRVYELIDLKNRISVNDEYDIDKEISAQIKNLNNKRVGLLLSGGMDSACLASYLKGCDAYTFRFTDCEFAKDEIERARVYAERNDIKLHYVDINWDRVDGCLDEIMIKKGAPVHSIEPQLYIAAKEAKKDGIEILVIGDAADYVFGGMDGLHKKDWTVEEFYKRYIYVNPADVLKNPIDLHYVFESYRKGDKIDFIEFMHKYTDIESYASYENAFFTADMQYLDPYEKLIMSKKLDLNRVRNGESKYLIRALFKMKYEDLPIPNKNPMPRPVDSYFAEWKGPCRKEFRSGFNKQLFTGNQLWLIYCLERYLDINSKNKL